MFLLYFIIFATTCVTANSYSMELELDFCSEIVLQAANNDNLDLLRKITSSMNLEKKHALSVIHAYEAKIKTGQDKDYYYRRAAEALSIILDQTQTMPIEMLDIRALNFLNTMAAYCENSNILKRTLDAILEYYLYDRKKIKQKFGKTFINATHICSLVEDRT